MVSFSVLGSDGSVTIVTTFMARPVDRQFAPNYVSIWMIQTYWLSSSQQQFKFQVAVAFKLLVCCACMQ
jgi:hypothetical protein